MTADNTSKADVIDVLIVDDHPFVREGIIAWMGRQKGLRCCGSTGSADQAFELITSLNPRIVLLDLRLRDGDGLELLRRIQGISPKPRVIVVSHKDQGIFAERALNAGALGYVLKDEASDTLLTAIQTVLRGGIHLSPEMNRRLLKGREVAFDAPVDRMRRLFNREIQVLEFLGQGRTTKEIAEEFGISPKTVESYRESLKKKLGVSDSVALIRLATIWQEEGRWGLPPANAQ
jgi:DNA-binding NarL/FixJ family response regulator